MLACADFDVQGQVFDCLIEVNTTCGGAANCRDLVESGFARALSQVVENSVGLHRSKRARTKLKLSGEETQT